MKNSAQINPRLMTGEQAADYLGITESELKTLRINRSLTFLKYGHRTIRYEVRALDAFIDASRVESVGVSPRRLWRAS